MASRFSHLSDFNLSDFRSIDGAPAAPMTIRVTHVYRRENGDWKIAHRHGDFAPVDERPPVEASTT